MPENKSIGQIAEDAWRENVEKIEAGEPTAPCWEAAAQAVRKAVIQELIESELSDEAIDDAEEARIEAIEAHRKHQAEVWANIGKPIPENAKGTAAFTWMPPAFKALLRSIANEGKDNG